MARKRGNDEYRRLIPCAILAEMQQVAEGVRGDDLLGDRDLLAVNRYGPNAEIWSLMRHSGIGQELHRRCGASNERGILDKRPRLGKHTAEKFGHEANRGEYVALCLVSVVKHISSYTRAPGFASLQTVETVPASIDRKA